MSGHREWNPERPYVARLLETWAPHARRAERWVVTDLWKFEQGSGREMLAVTIERDGRERRMSQSRFIAQFMKVE